MFRQELQTSIHVVKQDTLDAEMPAQQHKRDLAHAGLYLIALAILLTTLAFVSASARHSFPIAPLFQWVGNSLETSGEPQETHIGRVVANAREIREALAKPVPRAAPLPPITEKLAVGKLKGGPSTGEINQSMAQRKPRIPKAALNAMAMDTAKQYRMTSSPPPELHKVY